jgi:hypothetical protein
MALEGFILRIPNMLNSVGRDHSSERFFIVVKHIGDDVVVVPITKTRIRNRRHALHRYHVELARDTTSGVHIVNGFRLRKEPSYIKINNPMTVTLPSMLVGLLVPNFYTDKPHTVISPSLGPAVNMQELRAIIKDLLL